MTTFRAFIEYSRSLINASKLHRVEVKSGMLARGTLLIDCGVLVSIDFYGWSIGGWPPYRR